jgi:flagellar biosynthesis protein FlhG
MNDQAENLRKAIERLRSVSLADFGAAGAAAAHAPGLGSGPGPGSRLGAEPGLGAGHGPGAGPGRRGPARVFTVTSGKGGVGKTNISANLAIALSEMSYKVAIIDADFGLANIEVLFGVLPKFKLADAIHSEKPISQIICDGPLGVKFISGGTGVEELIKLDGEQISSLLADLSELDEEFDVIIIDTGAGLSDTVLGMSLAADEVIIVATPEPTSVTDAYALIKSLASRDRDKTIRLIVNRAESPGEAEDIMSKLIQVASKFLDLNLRKLGYILNDPLVVRSVKQQTPFLIGYPKSRISASTRDIALRLVEGDAQKAREAGKGLSGFFSRMSKLLSAQRM